MFSVVGLVEDISDYFTILPNNSSVVLSSYSDAIYPFE